jgi:hypothetical protein
MTKPQYEILNAQRGNLELIVQRHQPGNIPGTWKEDAAKIYMDILNRPKPNLGCSQCFCSMCIELYHQIIQHEKTR